MKYKALVTFSGDISMYKDEIKEICDEKVVKDLLNAGYISLFKKDTKSIKGHNK